jgi:Probable zinc-ribbon domain
VTRRKTKKLADEAAAWRAARIAKLIAAGWISDASAIPAGAVPVDPELFRGAAWSPRTYYEIVHFSCVDCGVAQIWSVEDQLWYYESTGAVEYSIAQRCRECRRKERQRKHLARVSAGHAKPTEPS